MMNDSYTIYDGEKEIIIYPLLEVNRENKKYLLYTNTTDFTKSDIMVGELTTNNELLPVDDSLLPYFEAGLNETIKKYKTIKGTVRSD